MRLSPDNNYIYSTGQDFVVGIFQIHDDKRKEGKEGIQVIQSEEILIS